ncbi:30S ribosomal protein S5 [Candidatus Parcubacteria bacterium]|nr:30S ribosomal protein S5 [Candidatus Parcubacteria bacterium]
MPEEQNKNQKVDQPAQAGAPKQAQSHEGGQGGFRKNPRRFSRGEAKVKPEFDQKIIDIRRVTRVVSGGRRFSFSVALVAGDRKGMVGVGLGKAGDTALAIEKALKNARKNFVKVQVTKDMSIPYEVSAKFASSRVTITPTPGRGIVAGSSIRSVIELAGLKDVGAKLRSGSKNRINNARVAIEALRSLTPHRRVLLSQRKSAAIAEANR